MAFITRDDYLSVIDDHQLSEVTRFNDGRLPMAEGKAVSFATGHLNNRFDTDAIFEQVGADRHPMILHHCLCISLYYLHLVISPDAVPQNILDGYVEAKDWFESVSAGKVNPPDLPMFEDGERDFIRYGSNTRRDNHI